MKKLSMAERIHKARAKRPRRGFDWRGLVITLVLIGGVLVGALIVVDYAEAKQAGPPPTGVQFHGIQSVTFAQVCEDKKTIHGCIVGIDADVYEWLGQNKSVDIVREHTSIATTSDANETVANVNRTVYVITLFYREK